MKFTDIDWADSELEKVQIEHDLAILTIWNDTLQRRIDVVCTGLAGITDLCIWDDMIILRAELNTVTDENDVFVRKLYSVYDREFDYGRRSLKEGLQELRIELSNRMIFSVYCQNVKIEG